MIHPSRMVDEDLISQGVVSHYKYNEEGLMDPKKCPNRCTHMIFNNPVPNGWIKCPFHNEGYIRDTSGSGTQVDKGLTVVEEALDQPTKVFDVDFEERLV